jgi:hypothetical protein
LRGPGLARAVLGKKVRRPLTITSTIGIGTTLGGIYGIGTPVGYAPENAPVGGYGPSSVSSKGSTIINDLFR